MSTNFIQTAFAAGELSPGLIARVDLAKVNIGAELLQDMFVDYKGGASSRPGTQFIGTPAASTQPCRVYPFLFSALQQYVLVFSHLSLQFVKNPGTVAYPNSSNAGFIQLSGSDYTITTPYTAAELFNLDFSQSGDVVQITHPNHPRMKLSRFADTNWTLTEVIIGAGIASPTGLTASITAVPVGSTDPGTTGYLYTVTSVSADGEESVLRDFVSFQGIDIGATQGTVTLKWTDIPIAKYYKVYKALPTPSGKLPPLTSPVGFIGFSYGNIFTDPNIQPDFTKAPPFHSDPFAPSQIKSIVITSSSSDWTVNATGFTITDGTGTGAYIIPVLSDDTYGSATAQIVDYFIVNGGRNYTSPTITATGPTGTVFTATVQLSPVARYPKASAYFQQRLVFASPTDIPLGIFASRPGFVDNFDVSNPTVDSDAYTFVLASQQVNSMSHMVPMPGGLMLFTNGSILLLTGGSSNANNPAAVTPSSAVANPQTFTGSSRIPPLIIGASGDILYAQDEGSTIQALSYNVVNNIYSGVDLTRLAGHLFYPRVISDWAYQDTPFKVVWACRDDGMLLSLTYLKDQDVWGFGRHTTVAGQFESVATIREGAADATYFVVSRNGIRRIERLTDRVYTTLTDCWCLDSALSYGGAPATVMTGLTHLNGFNVYALADGIPRGPFTVVAGQITLPVAASNVVVGLIIVYRLKSLRLDMGTETNTIQGKRKKVQAMSVRVRDTPGFKIGHSFTAMKTFLPNISSTDKRDVSGLYTGDMRMVVEPVFDVEGQICIEQGNGLPITVLGLIPEVVLGDQ